MRFQFVTAIESVGAAYGDDTYGGNITYGQSASDDIALGTYTALPRLQGGPSGTVWNYRVGDTTPPIEIVVAGTEDDQPINPAAVDGALLYLTRLGEPYQLMLPLDVGTVFTHELDELDLDQPGVYRAAVQMVMVSGRQLTVPVDDRFTMTVYPARGG